MPHSCAISGFGTLVIPRMAYSIAVNTVTMGRLGPLNVVCTTELSIKYSQDEIFWWRTAHKGIASLTWTVRSVSAPKILDRFLNLPLKRINCWLRYVNVTFLLPIFVLDPAYQIKDVFFVRSRWGRKLLVYQNYTYASNKRIQATNTTYWRCTYATARKEFPCEARCTTRQRFLVSSWGMHNHAPPTHNLRGKYIYVDYDIQDP